MSEAPQIYQLKVRLLGISPMIWRRVRVLDSTTLRELHGIPQVAMGREGLHLYAFEIYAGASRTIIRGSGGHGQPPRPAGRRCRLRRASRAAPGPGVWQNVTVYGRQGAFRALAGRIGRWTVRAGTPENRWQATFACPRTRTCRPPYRSFRAEFTLPPLERCL